MCGRRCLMNVKVGLIDGEAADMVWSRQWNSRTWWCRRCFRLFRAGGCSFFGHWRPGSLVVVASGGYDCWIVFFFFFPSLQLAQNFADATEAVDDTGNAIRLHSN
ncbi:hypothetical protein WN943_029485 [Citrus x changshan-huyou]